METIKEKRTLLNATIFASLCLATAFGLEHFAGYDPCILCWTQRAIVGAFILFGVLGLLLHPKSVIGRKTYASILSIISLAGVGIALRHVYILYVPPAESCGFGAEMIFQMLPWKEAIMEFIKGSPTCSELDNLFGIPFPYWSLGMFLTLSVASIRLFFVNKK